MWEPNQLLHGLLFFAFRWNRTKNTPYDETPTDWKIIMDENQNENSETNSNAAAYAQLFATALAAGICIGTGIVAGAEVTQKAINKVHEIRAARAAKKNAKKN